MMMMMMMVMMIMMMAVMSGATATDKECRGEYLIVPQA